MNISHIYLLDMSQFSKTSLECFGAEVTSDGYAPVNEQFVSSLVIDCMACESFKSLAPCECL